MTKEADRIYSREGRFIVAHDFSHHGEVGMAVITVARMCGESTSLHVKAKEQSSWNQCHA